MSAKSSRPAKQNPDVMLPADVELTPEKVEFVGADRVRVTLKSESGDIVAHTVTSQSLVRLVNLSVALINNHTAQVFRDLGVL